ncbi:MAG: ABC transporter permease subunit [Spirochaetales bacterium]|uniref:ABC transporter permease subunit n=1 Tax=Candidatus Thalassospirochaeta sargassi TaxID=3119039 RepID=A0AAJ1IEN5_9SPIO|nr:ABC transporter permease subunit [Spirochaetales bacterium]
MKNGSLVFKSIRSLLTVSVLILVFILPVLLLLMLAFSSAWRFPGPGPVAFSLRAFRYVFFQSPGFFQSILSSTFYSICTVILSLTLCILPARALAWEDFPLKRVVEGLLLSPVLLPVMTFSMGIHILMLKWGLTGTAAGIVVVLTLFNYPYMLRSLISGYQQFPRTMTETASNLGAPWHYTLVRVELPQLIPAIAAGAPVVFLTAFSEYFLVFLIGGGAVPSLSGYLFPFISGSDYPVSSLIVIIFIILPLLLFTLLDSVVYAVYKKRSLS